MSRLHEAASGYAHIGWPVFPIVVMGKTPATRHGFYDATTDFAQVDRWWTQDPNYNVGIACGAAGLVVIDVDDHAGLKVLREADAYPPATLTTETPSGGLHYIYANAGWEVRNTTGAVPGVGKVPGIDIRGAGGYIVVPPSRTQVGEYRFIPGTRTTPSPCPPWLREPERPRGVVPPPPDPGGHTRYGFKALEGIVGELAKTPDGQRNHALNVAAFKVGQLAAGGEVDPPDALRQLDLVAHRIGLEDREIHRTIESGYMSGLESPRKSAS